MSDSLIRVFILPPELGDGASKSLVKPGELAGLDIFNAMEEWMDGADVGKRLEIGWRYTTEGELREMENL